MLRTGVIAGWLALALSFDAVCLQWLLQADRVYAQLLRLWRLVPQPQRWYALPAVARPKIVHAGRRNTQQPLSATSSSAARS